ncbi:hypothetical protein D3C78_1923000 [compost metagenome]
MGDQHKNRRFRADIDRNAAAARRLFGGKGYARKGRHADDGRQRDGRKQEGASRRFQCAGMS